MDSKSTKKMNKIKRWSLKLLLPILLLFFFYWQNNDITITRYTYETEKMPDGESYKIVQISDLHNKRFGKGQRRLLAAVKKEQPDMIAVTGDLVDSNRTDMETAMEFIRGAVEIAPVYYVTGNHENWLSGEDRKKLESELTKAGVHILSNETAEIKVGKKSVFLAGLRDENLSDGTLHGITEGLGKELVILLAHEPQYIEQYSREKVDLALTGHAHGGQVRLPFVGGLVAPDQGIFPKYTAGVHTQQEMTMLISRGLGNSIIPVRIFNRPQVLVVTIQK